MASPTSLYTPRVTWVLLPVHMTVRRRMRHRLVSLLHNHSILSQFLILPSVPLLGSFRHSYLFPYDKRSPWLSFRTFSRTSSEPGLYCAYCAALSSGPPSPSKSRALLSRPRSSTLPPSSSGMSRFPPAPDAADPVTTLPPGNRSAADSSIPDSRAGVVRLGFGMERKA